MERKVIQSLRPNVTREQAMRAFTASGPATWYWKLRSGPLEGIADAYLPFRVYRVRFRAAGAQRTHLFAMDAVNGSLDLFEFPVLPDHAETLVVSTRNHAPLALSETRSDELLRDKVLRVVFQQGFFKLLSVQLEAERLPGEFHLPYWLGFYGSRDCLHCRVMDAVRRRMEGSKASALFEQWLAA
jgi:hypothetical protein